MAFSQQDARYEPATATLDNYSAADMMADLGIHRRSALPLAGRALIIPPPPPDINKHGPRLARLAVRDSGVQNAWGALYDPALVEERDDGLGEGQMHRTGPNYRPTEPDQKSPPRNIRHSRSLFELGRRPTNLPTPRGPPKSKFTTRRVIERRRNRSPIEFEGPPGDILAPLRLESVMCDLRSRAPRGPEAIVRHHLAGNPPATKRAVSAASHISSRVVPDNPNVSHWNLGRLATTKGGYDYLQSTPKKPTNPSLDLVQAREANKINHAAPVAGPSTTKNLPNIPIASTKNHGPLQLVAARPPPPVPSGCVPFILPDHDSTAAKLADVTNVSDKGVDARGGHSKEEIESMIKTMELVKSIVVPASRATDSAPKHHVPSMRLALNLSDKRTRHLSDMAKYALPTELDQEETEAYSLKTSEAHNTTYARGSTSSNESGIPEFYSPSASVNSLREGDVAVEVLYRDFYCIRKEVDRLKAKFLGFENFENSLRDRVNEIRRLKKEVLKQIEEEESGMRDTRRDIRALRMEHIRIAEGIRARVKKEAVYANTGPDSPASINAESTVRVKREKGVKHNMPVWVCKTDNTTSSHQQLDVVPKPEVQEKEKESSDIEMADVASITVSVSTKDEQIEEDHQMFQTFQVQLTEEPLEAPREESSEKGQEEDKQSEVLLSETKLFGEHYLVEEQIELEKVLMKKLTEDEENPKDRAESEELHKGQTENELCRLAEPNAVHPEQTGLDREGPEKKEPPKEQQAEASRAENQEITKVEVNTIAEDARGKASEKTCLTAEENFKQQPTEGGCSDKGNSEEGSEEKGRDETEALEVVHPETIRSEQEQTNQYEEDRSGTEKREQAEKERSEKENLEQQRQERELHDKAREEARHLRLEEEKLVRDHLALVKLQEKRRADEKTEKKEVEQLGDVQLSMGHKPTESTTDKMESIGEGDRGGVEQKEESKDMNLKKATVEDGDSESDRPTIEAGKQQEEPITTETASTEPTPPPLPTTNRRKSRVAFPYKIDLDLRPVFDYEPLRVKIQQFGRPDEYIVQDCKDLLTPAQFKELYEMPHFQEFLVNCNERHLIKMARYYGGGGR